MKRGPTNEPKRHHAMRAFLACGLLCVTWLVGTATPAAARDCTLDLNRFQIDASEVYKSLRCLVSSVNDLSRENARLKRRVAALEDVARAIPVPWVNIDGVVTQEPNRPISRASFQLSSRSTGGANALAIDQEVLEELCDKIGGCTLTIALKELNLFERKPQNRAISGPCRFIYTADAIEKNTWAVGAGCGAGAKAGADGDGDLGAGQGNSAEIAVAGGACLLSDSTLENTLERNGDLASDRNEGLFLIAIPSRQTAPTRRFQCEMSLE